MSFYLARNYRDLGKDTFRKMLRHRSIKNKGKAGKVIGEERGIHISMSLPE